MGDDLGTTKRTQDVKRLLFAFALLFASVSAFADDRLRVTSLEKWLTYYLDPKPAEVAAALRQVPEQGLSEDAGAQAALRFLRGDTADFGSRSASQG